MELVVDLEGIVVTLKESENLDHFSVSISEPVTATQRSHAHRFADVVAARHLGVVDEHGDLALNPEILRFLAAGEVEDAWEEHFDVMLKEAGKAGRIDPKGRLRTHVKWPGE